MRLDPANLAAANCWLAYTTVCWREYTYLVLFIVALVALGSFAAKEAEVSNLQVGSLWKTDAYCIQPFQVK